jgi:hypothetical protein
MAAIAKLYLRFWACLFYAGAAMVFLPAPVAAILDRIEQPRAVSRLFCRFTIVWVFPLGIYSVFRLWHHARTLWQQLRSIMSWLVGNLRGQRNTGSGRLPAISDSP